MASGFISEAQKAADSCFVQRRGSDEHVRHVISEGVGVTELLNEIGIKSELAQRHWQSEAPHYEIIVSSWRDEWITSLTEVQQLSTDISESSVVHEQDETDPKKDRPIQMEEFLRKYVSRRLLALNGGEIAVLTLVIRQLGVESPGGGEAFTIFHQLRYDVWTQHPSRQN